MWFCFCHNDIKIFILFFFINLFITLRNCKIKDTWLNFRKKQKKIFSVLNLLSFLKGVSDLNCCVFFFYKKKNKKNLVIKLLQLLLLNQIKNKSKMISTFQYCYTSDSIKSIQIVSYCRGKHLSLLNVFGCLYKWNEKK